MSTHYEILQLDENVKQEDIKKAYFKLLRKYPPEKAPEEYKKLNEAYEVLKDEKTRFEYDTFNKHGTAIKKHMNAGREALDNEEYDEAIKEFKKILLLEPKLTFARNHLGIALTNAERYDEAILQLAKLVEEYPENATFLYNLACAYRDKGETKKAEKMMLKAFELDNDDVSIAIGIADTYLDGKDYKKAIDFLNKCVDADGKVDFQDFIYFFKMTIIYILQNDMNNLNKVIDQVEKILPEDEETKDYIAMEFAKTAHQLYKLKAYDISEKLSRRAHQISPNNEAVKELNKISGELAKAHELMKKLFEDERIIGPIKGPAMYYLTGDEYSEEELKKIFNENLNAIQSYIEPFLTSNNEVVKSIDLLKSQYKMLYEYKKELYDEVYKIAKNNSIMIDKLKLLEKDYEIDESIKKFIFIIIASDINDNERKRYFDNNIQSLYNKNLNVLESSILKLEKNYKELYQINPNLFNGLLNTVREQRNNNSSNSNSSSCYIATVCYGDINAKEVCILRKYRDEVLRNSFCGRIFIKTYYFLSPKLSIWLNNKVIVKTVIRERILDKIVRRIQNKIK